MSIWTALKKFASQLGITYNETGKTYNETGYNYGGKLGTQWTNRTKN